MAGLWSATLWIMLPEAKARYAVYPFLGFFPLLAAAGASKWRLSPLIWVYRRAIVIICLLSVLGAMPVSFRACGIGFLGSLILWVENVRLLLASARPPNLQTQSTRYSFFSPGVSKRSGSGVARSRAS